MELAGHILEWFFIVVPPLGCVCGWWFWIVSAENDSIPIWRRVVGLLGLIAVTTSIAFGGFAWMYWRRFPESTGPPEPTYVATYRGLYAALVGIPISFCAKSRTRVALVFSCLGLIGFYFLMFLSP